MSFDFDKEIDRHGTNSLKWDWAEKLGKPSDVLPLWVADMDFQAPKCVLEALQKTVAHGVFGYSEVQEDYYETVAGWFQARFGWNTRPEWLVKTPGVVFALAMAVRALTQPGDAVLVQPPIYYPFFAVIRDNKRVIVANELHYVERSYAIDFDDFENKIKENKVKLFMLCSPHNPVCRVWTKAELRRMGEICAKYDVYVVSDEIHCDFAFPNHRHTILLEACPELTDRTIICTSPSKTFNLAGLQISNVWIPNAKLRRAFRAEIAGTGYAQLNTMGLVAAKAAYAGGGAWLDECKIYLRGNLDDLRTFFKERLPEIHLVEPEGTYFAWLDCSALGLNAQGLDDLITNKARLWLDAGSLFGEGGAQFQRMALACTRKTLHEALRRLASAVRNM